MEQKKLQNAVISKIIHRPLKENIPAYEDWLKEIIPVASNFNGHQAVNIIRPHAQHDEYTIVLHFESEDSLKVWFNSSERSALIAKVRPLLSAEEKIKIQTGLDFWFTPPNTKTHAPTYKQFLITLSAIYPLTIIVPWALAPVFAVTGISDIALLTKLFIAIGIVGLMVYVIMPRYTRLIARWLYR